jgi:NMD protein affecting ribosome stability and mRNA decay
MAGKKTDFAGQKRGDRLIKERVHDPYMSHAKLPEPTVCPGCSAVFHTGRWQWAPTSPADANEELCPACRRIKEKVPAGFLTLSGGFFDEHRDEIMNLVHNKVEAQKAQHALQRIMNIEDRDGGGVVITFTDTHLPRGVGEAIEHACKGELDIHYTEEAGIVRVTWTRQQ